MRQKRKLSLVFFVVLGFAVTVVADALAVVGRPATPASVAGVARRTARRNTRPY